MRLKELFLGQPETRSPNKVKLRLDFIQKTEEIWRRVSPNSGDNSLIHHHYELVEVKISGKLLRSLRKIQPSVSEIQTINISCYSDAAKNRAELKLIFQNPNFPLEFQAYDNPERFDMQPEEPDVLKRLALANETVEFIQKAIN